MEQDKLDSKETFNIANCNSCYGNLHSQHPPNLHQHFAAYKTQHYTNSFEITKSLKKIFVILFCLKFVERSLVEMLLN